MGSYNEDKDEMEDTNDDVDYTDGNSDVCNDNDENDNEDSTCRRLLAKSSQSRQGRRERFLFNSLVALALHYRYNKVHHTSNVEQHFISQFGKSTRNCGRHGLTCGTKLCLVLCGDAGLRREFVPTAGLQSVYQSTRFSLSADSTGTRSIDMFSSALPRSD